MDTQVPLVVPEINPQSLHAHRGIIANPNCCAIISITPLWPIHRTNRIERLQLATYQAASGAGAAAMEELRESTRAYLEGRSYAHKVLPHPYAFNLFSHNTAIDPATGYNGEETKVMAETRKIFSAPDLRVAITCVRVPVLRAHSIAITLECEKPINPDQARAFLSKAPGVRVVDDGNSQFFRASNLELVSKGQVVLTLRGVPNPQSFRHGILNACNAWVPGRAALGGFIPASAGKTA